MSLSSEQYRNQRTGRIAPIALALLAAAAIPARAGASPAAAASPARTAAVSPARAAANPFTCSATPLRITAAGRPATNPARPCRDDRVGGAQSTGTVGAVQVSAVGTAGSTALTAGTVLEATTVGTTVGGRSTATAKSARLVVGKTVIVLGAMSTRSEISCAYSGRTSSFSFHSTSSVDSVTINGKSTAVGAGAKSIPVPGGTLWLNHSEVTRTGVVTHAAMLHTPAADVVLGEAAVGLSAAAGNPCRS